MPDSVKTVDNTKAPAAGDVDGSNETNDDGVKTVDNTEAPAAGEVNGNNDGDKAETKETIGNDGDKSEDKAETKETTGNNDGDKSEAKSEDKETTDNDGDKSEDNDDSLDDDELDALDAKVRRRVSKVQRENVNLRTRLKDAEGARDKVQRENDRLTVALNAGLSGDMLKFLTGETTEELENNAADLLEVIGYNGRVTPSNGPVEYGSNPRRNSFNPASEAAAETNLDDIGARIYRR